MALQHDSLQPAIGYGGPHIPHPTSQSQNQSQNYPSSHLQLSDVRSGTKRKRQSISAATTASTNDNSVLSTPSSIQGDHDFGLHPARKEGIDSCFFDSVVGTPHDLCLDCVVDCDDADCPVSATEQCTEQCIVVPCNGDDQKTCNGTVCTEEPCTIEDCDGGNPCFGPLDQSLQLLCCATYHDSDATSSQINWNSALDDILGLNGHNYAFPGSYHLPPHNAQLNNSSDTANSAPELPLIQTNHSNIGGNVLPTPDHVNPTTPTPQALAQPSAGTDFVCRWLGCNLSFSSLNELVGHVNLTHLRPPSSTSPKPSKKPRLNNSAVQDSNLALSCHWDDCHIYPDASTLPGPSTGLQPEMAFDLLSSHFFHDHLGLAVPPSQILPVFQSNAGQAGIEPQQNVAGTMSVSGGQVKQPEGNASASSIDSAGKRNKTIEPTYATPEPSPPDTTSLSSSTNNTRTSADPPHDCSTSTHTCHWHSCGLTFPTCAALTEHLASSHVGSGKGHYDCHWGDCHRSGKQGFTSKQKIMRHLQAHTGYRPYLCKECGCFFSEAATLAQHMRRHTQEKPFVCDFPGCGKAFAITGALTIHKRTHNGERPFRCPHCDRAFAESSNLSKHLRTHTGDRPYRCTEPGCGKTFARPDQLQRHGNVHKKKIRAGGGVGVDANATDTSNADTIEVK